MVEPRSMVRGAPPGPAPAAQALASNSRLTPVQLADMAPTETAQEGTQSLPSRKRGVDATSVIILSPVFARPGALPRSRCRVNQLGQPKVQGQGGRQDQPSIGR